MIIHDIHNDTYVMRRQDTRMLVFDCLKAPSLKGSKPKGHLSHGKMK